MPLVCSLTLFS